MRPALINGLPGAVVFRHGQPFSIGAVAVRNGKIVELDFLNDPRAAPLTRRVLLLFLLPFGFSPAIPLVEVDHGLDHGRVGRIARAHARAGRLPDVLDFFRLRSPHQESD
jgi:hypothetical protein